MTLLEIMVVLAILALVMGLLVGPRVRSAWREAQISGGRRITYGDLVKQAIHLNKTKRGPLRMAHGRYINFISDFLAANRKASHAAAVRAWKAIKAMDAPKTYDAWAKKRRQ